MSDLELIRQSLEASLPPGSFWISQKDFSLLLDALAEEIAPYFADAKNAANIRDVDLTDLIYDLADEYGVDIFSTLTEAQVRDLVRAAKMGVRDPGIDTLENVLISAGFNVQVHRNGPTPTSPFTYIGDAIPFMVDGNEKAVDGNEEAIDGTFPGGYILVNGDIKSTLPEYSSCDGNEEMCDGNDEAVDGYFLSVADFDYTNAISLDSSTWHSVYFVGGDATRDPITGEITGISEADVASARQKEFESLILKYGPGDGWAGLVINYV